MFNKIPYTHYDAVLIHLKGKDYGVAERAFTKSTIFKDSGIVLKTLLKLDYISKQNGHNGYYYHLEPEGLHLIDNGGFKKVIENAEREYQETSADKLRIKELEETTIASNREVIKQTKIQWFNFGLAVLAVIISLIALYISYIKP